MVLDASKEPEGNNAYVVQQLSILWVRETHMILSKKSRTQSQSKELEWQSM